MPLVQCPRCKKLFERIRFPVCPKCQDEEEKDYDKVRSTLDDMPNLNAEQVSEITGVSLPCITRMLKEGLIANSETLGAEVKCGMCGRPAISASKKLCQACLEKLNAKVTQAQSKIKLEEKKEAQVNQYLTSMRSTFEKKRRT